MDVPTVCIVIGVLLIVTRGPLLFAPTRTLEIYRALVTARPRWFGAAMIVSGILLFVAGAQARSGFAGFVGGVALAVVGVGAIAGLSPRTWTSIASRALGWLGDPAVSRVTGLIAALLGGALIYAGAFATG